MAIRDLLTRFSDYRAEHPHLGRRVVASALLTTSAGLLGACGRSNPSTFTPKCDAVAQGPLEKPVAIAPLANGSCQMNANPSPLPAPAAPQVIASSDAGTLTVPAGVTGRDDGISQHLVPVANHPELGNMILWLFGDTLLTKQTVDTHQYIRSSTAALGPAGPDSAQTAQLKEPLDANGMPYEFLPFTPAEAQWNFAQSHPQRWAHWVGGAVETGTPANPQVVVYYDKLQTQGALFLPRTGEFTTTAKPGSTQANPVAAEKPLFGASAASYHPVRVYDAQDGYQYFIAPKLIPSLVTFSYTVARAPKDQLQNPDAYQYWAGKDVWSKDATAAQTPANTFMNGNAASISYDPYLKKFLMLTSGGDSTELRVSNSIVGDWSDPVEVKAGMIPPPTGSFFGDYAGTEHPELAVGNGKQVFASYLASATGRLHMLGITFK